MSLINKMTIFRSLLMVGIVLLGGCASQDPLEYRPRPDMEVIKEMLNCPSDRTPICVERIGKPYSCFCMDEDSLRKILEPDKY